MGAKLDRDSEHWNRLWEEAEHLDVNALRERVSHYEGMQNYLGIFRVTKHIYESFFGEAVTLDQYEVAQRVLNTRNVLRHSERMFV